MIVQGINAILQFLGKFWDIIKTVFSWFLDGFLYVLKAAFFFVLDGFLTAVLSIVGTLDLGTMITSSAGLWAGLPPQLIYVINAMGFPTGLSMLAFAIGIRKVIDLIPAAFTRF